MAGRSRASRGLAARVVRATLVVGVATVLTAAGVALWTTSDLASERAAARDLVALQMVEGAFDERLRAVDDVIERASVLVASSRNETDLPVALSSLFEGSGTLFDRLMVVEAGSARTLAAEPDALSRSQVRGLRAFRDAVRGSTGLVAYRTEQGDLAVWTTRTAVTSWGSAVIVIGRLDEGFVTRLLERAVRDQPGRLMVLTVDGRVAAWTGIDVEPVMSRARWTPDGEGVGRVTLPLARGPVYTGFYNDIEGAGRVTMRVAVMTPMAADVGDTIRTVAPSIGVLLLGGAVAVALAWSVSRQLVRPLRDLERVARSAASGAYVKPLPVGEDEIGRVSEAFNQVALRLNALHDLSQLLASASRLDQVLDGILSAMGHIVGPGASAVYLLDQEGARLVPVRTRGIAMSSVRPVETGESNWLVGALGSTGPVMFDGSAAELARELPGLAGSATSAVAAPLVAGHETLGLVVMLRDATREVTDAEREMLRTFSAQAAVAVQTSRLFEIESESRHVAEALRAVAEELVRPTDLDSALLTVEGIVAELFGAPQARIVLTDRASLGLPDTGVSEDDVTLLEVARRCLEPGGATAVVPRGADAVVDRVLEMHGGDELAVVPIDFESDHGAALVIVHVEATGSGVRDIERALADEVALALDNAYFYQRALTRAANLETIFRISQVVASSLQTNVVLNRVLDVVQKILSADGVMLWSYDPRKRTLVADMVRGDVPAHVVRMELEPGEDLPGRVFQSGKPTSIKALSVGMGGVAGSAASQGSGSLLAVPLLARDRPIGVLMVLSSQPDAFSDEDLNMLQMFASQAALAIDTARLYSREHEVAHILQKSILPEALPSFPEIEVASVYAPAGGDADIGGDYYDLFRARDGAIWFAIADVCGKGVQAATKTSMIKYALRAFVATGSSPARVVGEINRMKAESGDPSDIVTLWVGRYSPETETLSWADGGHPPAVMLRADGTRVALEATGPLLGALPDVEYEQREVPFALGDKVLLYTDGVTEARRGNTFFGESRVMSALSTDRTVVQDARLLVDEVRAFVSAELRDDVAILVVQARGTSDTTDSEG